MSIHSLEERAEYGEPGQTGILWAECGCGWIGPQHEQTVRYDTYKLVRRDYREHVEEALGADAYYDAGVRCTNCGSAHRQGIIVGTRVREGRCQRCGTSNLIPDNEAHDEEVDRMKQWRF